MPFLWLILTAVKEDEELVPARLRILPAAPEPRAVSPYIANDYFSVMAAPETMSPSTWQRLGQPVTAELQAALQSAGFIRALPVDHAEAVRKMVPGLWIELLDRLPDSLWTKDDQSIIAAVRQEASDPECMERVFDRVYRRTSIGRASIRDNRFVEYQAGSDWTVVDGNATLAGAFSAIDPDIRDLHYRFDDTGIIRLRTAFDSAVQPDAIKQISIPLRADRSCHRIHVSVKMKGRIYESVSDFILVGSRWSEIIFQEPSDDDSKPMQRNWTVIRETGASAATGNRVEIEVTLIRSSIARAWWGKLSSNFDKVLRQVPFAHYLWVSIFLACANITLTIFSSSMVAYAFARMEWPGRRFFFILMLSTMMIPAQVTMIPQFIIFRSLGWYNTLWPLWLPSLFGNAFFIFLLVQAMKGIPKDLLDAGRIDGCGFLRIYWHVILPNVKASLAAVAIFTFMGSWNNFMGPLIYVNDQRLYNLAIGLFTFQLQSGGSLSLLMAGSLIMIMPVLIIFFFAQRYFIQGVVMSGVKE
jgi:ABC-type glycerol-3-phosphate transport system permease component